MKRFLTMCATGALVVGGSVLAAQPAHAATPPSYAVMLLQPVGGLPNSHASGINARGDVVGSSEPTGLTIDGGGHATLWKSRTGHGTAFAPQFPASQQLDVAGDGTIVGNWAVGQPSTFWYADGTGTAIQHEGAYSRVGQISETGKAVFTVYATSSQVFTVTSPTALTALPDPAGSTSPSGVGISDDGRHVVGTAQAGSATVPALWTDGVGKLLALPTGATAAHLASVNDAGTSSGCATIGGVQNAFRFTAAGAATKLPALAGFPSACANAINNSGALAGTSSTANHADSRAVVWVDGVVHDLNAFAAQRAGYTLTSVNGINASGQIVGSARLADGTYRGFIATPSTAETIYTAPGYHRFNGRAWKTACEPYSRTTRCRTEIVATQVQYKNGGYSRVTDWAFNNLTYTPSPRSLWARNPLGNTGEWTADDGRKWRTECDTPTTGKNGCRSYVFARVADATPKPGGGYTYTVESMWVFNNIVKFS
ncbi:hypothetical protein FOJ82_08705 [Tessaracoccus rhinocerotis]|uniref:DUF3466 family protein n=1 Tax=Tessaracoccus rhinocerotis TaxID=1689449 RepID=A0A553K0A2_9ACTN|nr:hypothetical protein [Tessaracoccus rhinocerotis]TRY18128.1 hypothetical protein FOJ82_08705 [Tessaracoccus rhinocerotis]